MAMLRPDEQNYVVIVLDSCRYDSMTMPNPLLELMGYPKGPLPAYAPANWTLPSHISMMRGFFPENPYFRLPYICREVKQLIRSAAARPGPARLVYGGIDLAEGFNRLGYFTQCSVALPWLTPESFSKHFQKHRCHWTGDNNRFWFVVEQFEGLEAKEPFFWFVNLGETHIPYATRWQGAQIHSNQLDHPRDEGIFRRAHELQRSACTQTCQHIASVIGDKVDLERTNILITADHADVFGCPNPWIGEIDKVPYDVPLRNRHFWGHTFHHEQVYLVPWALKLAGGETVV